MSSPSSDFPHITLNNEPLYVLTNQGCEDTGYWTTHQFAQFGLDYGKWNGQDYPLTDEELSFISFKHIMTPADGELMFGYTALFQGQKWLMPSVEYMKPTSRGKLSLECKTLEQLVAPYQGRVVIDRDGPHDRVTVLILVPIRAVQEVFRLGNAWEHFLERGIGTPLE